MKNIATTTKTNFLSLKYKIQEIPAVYLIDSKGVIEHVHTGFKKEDITDLEKEIKEIIQGGVK